MTINQRFVAFGLTITALVAYCDSASAQARPRTQPRKPPAARPAPKAAPKAAPKPATPKVATPRPKPEPAAPKPEPAETPPAEAPANEAPKPGAAGVAGTPEDLGPKLETDPAVLTALELPRKKPADYLQSVLWLIDLSKPELAKSIMADLAKLPLSDTERIELVDEFGSSNMLKLANAAALAPDGAAFADACMSAAAAAKNNLQRIDTLVAQLADPSPEVRLVAQHDLAAIGPKAATATLEAFAKETNPHRRAMIAEGVTAMHPLTDGMLLAMLDSRDDSLRASVAGLLRRLEVPQALPLLSATDAAAERDIAAALHAHTHGTPVFPADQQNRVELWQWNDETKQLSPVFLTANEARTYWIAKLARSLYHIRPENPIYQRQALALAWEAAALDSPTRHSGPDPQKTATLPTDLLNDVLADALAQNHPHAAVAAADALTQRGDRSALITLGGKASPLADALASPDRSVRFAALRAIMTLDPASPYPGSSRVPDALAWFAGASAQRQALVAMPTQAAAADLAGFLSAHSLDSQVSIRGREAINMARDMTDLEAIFVDMNIIEPGIREVIYELRTNPTTGEVPIVILAADGRLEMAKRLAAEHQRVIAVPRPHSPEVVANTLNVLAGVAAPDTVPANERASQAAMAKEWLTKLESGGRPFYVIRRTARMNVAPPHTEPPVSSPNR